MKGIVTVEHTVWCARARLESLPFRPCGVGCESHFQVSGTSSWAQREARGQGWTRTTEFGWLCPACVAGWMLWTRQLKRAQEDTQ